jgi:hypothetical protein
MIVDPAVLGVRQQGGQGQGAGAQRAQPSSDRGRHLKVSLRYHPRDFAMIPQRCQSPSFFSERMGFEANSAFFWPPEEVLREFLYNSLLRL